MKTPRFFCCLAAAAVFALVLATSARADAGQPAALHDVHQLLLQAAGADSDSAPPPDQEKAMLQQALGMIRHVPHVYHGQLVRAVRILESALDELANGDPAHKVREDILNADDLIKPLLD